MRSGLSLLGGLACGLAATSIASADIIYTETFPNASTTVQATMTSVGWSAYLGSAATDVSGTTTQGSTISTNASVFDSARGYGARTAGASPIVSGDGLFITTEPGPIAQTDLQSISFLASDANTTDSYRIAIQIGGNWYATDATYASSVVGSTTFQNSTSESLTFTTAGSAWRAVTFTAGSALSIASTALGGTLPAGAVSAFGLYTNANTGTLRFDNYSISTPEPGCLTALGGLLVLARRRRR